MCSVTLNCVKSVVLFFSKGQPETQTVTVSEATMKAALPQQTAETASHKSTYDKVHVYIQCSTLTLVHVIITVDREIFV